MALLADFHKIPLVEYLEFFDTGALRIVFVWLERKGEAFRARRGMW
jgi:hypothetical protein